MVSFPVAQYRHWTEAFLGVGYVRGGQGPEVYDCWTYWLWVQRERFGRRVPPYATPPTLRTIAKAMPAWAAEFGWSQVEQPIDGDAVFMSHMKHATHIGTWICDGTLQAVLHCPEGGAVLHDRAHLAVAGWRIRGFYRPEV